MGKGMSLSMTAADRASSTADSAVAVAAPVDATLSIAALLQLQNWMSPAFPIGAYTCSHGLESAIADGVVTDASTLGAWLRDILERGSAWNDAVILNETHAAVVRGRHDRLLELASLALALSAGDERYRESLLLGASFRRAAAAWIDERDPLAPFPDGCPLPVAVGALAATSVLPVVPVLACSLQSTVANLAWIATRLVPLGQSDTLALLAVFEPMLATLADRAAASTLDDLGGCAVLADIASLRHEHLDSRVCRT